MGSSEVNLLPPFWSSRTLKMFLKVKHTVLLKAVISGIQLDVFEMYLGFACNVK